MTTTVTLSLHVFKRLSQILLPSNHVHVLNKKRSRNNGTIAQTRVGDRAGWPAAKHPIISATQARPTTDKIEKERVRGGAH